MSSNPEIVGSFTDPGYYVLTEEPELARSTLVRGATGRPVECR